MPLVGFICPSETPTKGEKHPFDYCINKCPHQCCPICVMHTVQRLNSTNYHKGDVISPTSLKGCTRKLVWSRTKDYYETPGKCYSSTRGSLYHGFLEAKGLEGIETETRLWKRINANGRSIIISGTLDQYDHKRRKVEDLKTKDTSALPFLFNQGADEDYEAQLNVYAWMCAGGRLKQAGKPYSDDDPVINWPVDELQLHFLTMKEVISTGVLHAYRVTSKQKPNYGKPFTYEVNREQEGTNRKGTPIWRVDIRLPKVPIWSHDRVECYIANSAPTLVSCFEDTTRVPPAPPLSNDDMLWQCDYCPFCGECAKAESDARLAAIEEDELLLAA